MSILDMIDDYALEGIFDMLPRGDDNARAYEFSPLAAPFEGACARMREIIIARGRCADMDPDKIATLGAECGALDIFEFAIACGTRGESSASDSERDDERDEYDAAEWFDCDRAHSHSRERFYHLRIQFDVAIYTAATYATRGNRAQRAARAEIISRAREYIDAIVARAPYSQCESEYIDCVPSRLYNRAGQCIFDANVMLCFATRGRGSSITARMMADGTHPILLARKWGARSYGGMFCAAAHFGWIEGCELAYDWVTRAGSASCASYDYGAYQSADRAREFDYCAPDCDWSTYDDAIGYDMEMQSVDRTIPFSCVRTRACGVRAATFARCSCMVRSDGSGSDRSDRSDSGSGRSDSARCAMFEFMHCMAIVARAIARSKVIGGTRVRIFAHRSASGVRDSVSDCERDSAMVKLARVILGWIREYYAPECAREICDRVIAEAEASNWEDMRAVAREAIAGER